MSIFFLGRETLNFIQVSGNFSSSSVCLLTRSKLVSELFWSRAVMAMLEMSLLQLCKEKPPTPSIPAPRGSDAKQQMVNLKWMRSSVFYLQLVNRIHKSYFYPLFIIDGYLNRDFKKFIVICEILQILSIFWL